MTTEPSPGWQPAAGSNSPADAPQDPPNPQKEPVKPEVPRQHFIREGQGDGFLGRFVVDLIASEATPQTCFAVFLDEDLGIQWYVRDNAGNCLIYRYFSDNFPLVLNDVVHLETLSGTLFEKPVAADTRLWVQESIDRAIEKSRAEEKGAGPGSGGGSAIAASAGSRDAGKASAQATTTTTTKKKSDVEHLDTLRQQNPNLRAARRLIAEALARAYVPPGDMREAEKTLEEAMQVFRDASAALAAAQQADPNSPPAAAALANAQARLDDARKLEELARAALTKSETEQATRRATAGQAAVKCVELARDYLNKRSSDRGRQKMLMGAALALLIMLVAAIHSFRGQDLSPAARLDANAAQIKAVNQQLEELARPAAAASPAGAAVPAGGAPTPSLTPSLTPAGAGAGAPPPVVPPAPALAPVPGTGGSSSQQQPGITASPSVATPNPAPPPPPGAPAPTPTPAAGAGAGGAKSQAPAVAGPGLAATDPAPALAEAALKQRLQELSGQRVALLRNGGEFWLPPDFTASMLIAAAVGALGAMLSLLPSSATRAYDAGAGSVAHALEGICRILAGVLGACFITLGLRSEFLMGFLERGVQSEEKLFYLQLLLGFAAGLSERLVPNFVSTVEAQVQTK